MKCTEYCTTVVSHSRGKPDFKEILYKIDRFEYLELSKYKGKVFTFANRITLRPSGLIHIYQVVLQCILCETKIHSHLCLGD